MPEFTFPRGTGGVLPVSRPIRAQVIQAAERLGAAGDARYAEPCRAGCPRSRGSVPARDRLLFGLLGEELGRVPDLHIPAFGSPAFVLFQLLLALLEQPPRQAVVHTGRHMAPGMRAFPDHSGRLISR